MKETFSVSSEKMLLSVSWGEWQKKIKCDNARNMTRKEQQHNKIMNLITLFDTTLVSLFAACFMLLLLTNMPN